MIKVIMEAIEAAYKQHKRSDKISISIGDLVDLRSHIKALEKENGCLKQQLAYSENRRRENVALYESLRTTDSFDSYKLSTRG